MKPFRPSALNQAALRRAARPMPGPLEGMSEDTELLESLSARHSVLDRSAHQPFRLQLGLSRLEHLRLAVLGNHDDAVDVADDEITWVDPNPPVQGGRPEIDYGCPDPRVLTVGAS